MPGPADGHWPGRTRARVSRHRSAATSARATSSIKPLQRFPSHTPIKPNGTTQSSRKRSAQERSKSIWKKIKAEKRRENHSLTEENNEDELHQKPLCRRAR